MLLVLSASNAVARDYGCGKIPLISTVKEDGTRIGILASEEQFSKSPTWTPGKGEPPLPISKAVEIAEKWAKNEYKRYDDVKIDSIRLTQFGCMSQKGYWYYTFDFSPVIEGNVLHGSGNFAAVLMDGTVIGPTKVKERF